MRLDIPTMARNVCEQEREKDYILKCFIASAKQGKLLKPTYSDTDLRNYLEHSYRVAMNNMKNGTIGLLDRQHKPLEDGVRLATGFILAYEMGYMQANRDNEVAPMINLSIEDEEAKSKLSTGQTWTNKLRGYDVEVTYINRRVGGVRVEEVATGQPDGYCIEVFLERFSFKGKGNNR